MPANPGAQCGTRSVSDSLHSGGSDQVHSFRIAAEAEGGLEEQALPHLLVSTRFARRVSVRRPVRKSPARRGTQQAPKEQRDTFNRGRGEARLRRQTASVPIGGAGNSECAPKTFSSLRCCRASTRRLVSMSSGVFSTPIALNAMA